MKMEDNIHTYLGKDEVNVALYCINYILEKKIYIGRNGAVLGATDRILNAHDIYALSAPATKTGTFLVFPP